jgi:hypothetical protein
VFGRVVNLKKEPWNSDPDVSPVMRDMRFKHAEVAAEGFEPTTKGLLNLWHWYL